MQAPATIVKPEPRNTGLGRLQEAEEFAERGRLAEEALGRRWAMAHTCAVIGTVSLCQRRWDRAEEAFQKAAQLGRAFVSSEAQPIVTHILGRAYLPKFRPNYGTREHEQPTVKGTAWLYIPRPSFGRSASLDTRCGGWQPGEGV